MDPQPFILVADDDADIRNLVVKRLGKRGWNVLAAQDGAEAVAMARSERPAAIVVDWMMPKMTGPEVCAALKADPDTAAIPIVLVTARASGGDRDAGLEHGADDYVTKPFDIDDLDAVLRRLLSPAGR
jgi:DNA-binding response OmpR family regulator